MDVKVDNTILPNWVSTYLANNKKMMEKISEEVTTFNEHLVTLQDENYDMGSKRLKIERVKVHKKKVICRAEMDVDVSKVGATGLMKLHQATSEVLGESISQ